MIVIGNYCWVHVDFRICSPHTASPPDGTRRLLTNTTPRRNINYARVCILLQMIPNRFEFL